MLVGGHAIGVRANQIIGETREVPGIDFVYAELLEERVVLAFLVFAPDLEFSDRASPYSES